VRNRAAEKGFAEKQGIELKLIRETSWANIRDRLVVGHFDAAHMLGPMAVASSLGIGHLTVPIVAPLSLGLGGNAVTVANAVWQQMLLEGAALHDPPAAQGAALKRVVQRRSRANLAPLTFGMVYPFSCHNYELRYWLAACGIDPDRDVRLVVIPPPFLVDAMREGQIDGFCVGEPWNSIAVDAGVGTIVALGSEIWRLCPEKVLGCRADWAEQHPARLDALVRAIHEAALWCEAEPNQEELAHILAQPRYVGVPANILLRGLSNRIQPSAQAPARYVDAFYSTARNAATFPWASHAVWFYTQMVRWGQIDFAPATFCAAYATYRPDLYRRALAPLGHNSPAEDVKDEGVLKDRGMLPGTTGDLAYGPDGFFDNRIFAVRELMRHVEAGAVPLTLAR
jgi:ABC-type nitrate/sulfonate/bicarbonate transport system substrate-binding protein